MRTIDNPRIAAAAAARFRSEYDYALWEYLRSAKVIAALERARVSLRGRVLDAGCGSGGTALSLAEETAFAIGLDLDARFRDSGTRLMVERGIRNAGFVQGDGERLPFREGSFDLVFSHSVIEHVASAERYLAECRRVLKPGGVLYLSTAPWLSLAGAHLPRLRVPLPIHIPLGRRAAFRIFLWLGRHAPWALQEPREANTFIALAAEGKDKRDDLLQKVTVARLEAWIQGSGLRRVHEERQVTGFFRRALPNFLRHTLLRAPVLRDVMIGHIQCVLVRP
ncbi:MAG TPA: class I SAM-dependent methyltransferase [Vicinamibacteria bacterium]|nr:class I SAM-dependent methyltransferase [Vicinamibacteria bacterium]